MILEYNVSEQDYLNFNLFHLNHSKQGKNARFFLRYAPSIMCLLVFFVIFWGEIVPYIIGVALAIAWIVLFPKYFDNRLKKYTKKFISEGKCNDFIGPQKLILGDDHIESISSKTASTVKYEAVERIGCDYDCIFVYIGAIQAYIVPISAFSDEDQKNEFINILTEKTGIQPTGDL